VICESNQNTGILIFQNLLLFCKNILGEYTKDEKNSMCWKVQKAHFA